MASQPAAADIAQLVAEHHQAVYGYAYRLPGSVADAEDHTQQVFLAAQQKLSQLRSVESARGWLFAILRNGFLKACQKRRSGPDRDPDVSLENIPAEIPGDEAIDREQLQKAMDALPPAYRLVLVMFYFEDCSYRQIAEQLDLPMGTVMSRLARAKAYLRSRLFEPASVDRSRPKVRARPVAPQL